MIRKRHSVIVTTLLIALVLQIVPLPIQVDLYRPDWVLIVLAYWSMALPHRVNAVSYTHLTLPTTPYV